MTIEIDPSLVPPRPPPSTDPSRRFFIADDPGQHWIGVARDRDHFIDLLEQQGAEWEGYLLDELQTYGVREALALEEVEIRELTPDEVATKHQRCHTEDERGVIPLAEAAIGDLFCSEW